ncbi:hypothetical protein TanjilG_25125 [Lupinus angustifolius]|uniref:protein-disulfide reductase n=1 Tax=Lupinus angustifolius TaxID=3871 RepID=A0A1J7INK4_LUPAN|nr:hypothetical protein TanjilG_25125 [Lupinus angustifolius]
MANDVESLFSTTNRDFLISNNDHEVKIESLKGKKVGIYFSSSWCGPCRKFTPFLVEVYNELAPKGDFEVIFVSADEDDESFKAYFSKMPWLAIPFSDSDTRNHLDELFDVKGIPHLVLLDETGKIVTDCGTEVIREFGVEGYPFSSERIQELNDQEEEDKKNQTLTSILTSPSRNFVISSHGKKILVSDLEGKTIGLYFSLTPDKAYDDFTPRLVEDQSCEKLARYFELSAIPTLVIIGPNGRTLHSNVVEFIEEHGIDAYPFTPEKFDELIGIQKAEDASQTLESILVSGDEDLSLEKMEKGKGSKDDAKEEKKSKDEWVCDGEVCFKA